MSERQKVLELFEQQKEFYSTVVADGIENNRKGTATLTVTDGNGNVAKGAKIRFKQKSHQFKFGANIFMLDELETEDKNGNYKKYFADVFNMATLPFYWNTLEPEKGTVRYEKDSKKVYRRPAPDLCLEFCEKHGIEPREHALAYEHVFPQWLHGESVETAKKELERRFSEIALRYADKIPTIEVTNEMDWPEGITALYTEPDFVEYCFKLAEKYFPNNELCINEWTGLCWEDKCITTDKYYSYIEANMLKGARVDAIGMQYHLFIPKDKEYEQTRKLLDPKNLYRHMDMYSLLKKPLQITEVTVPSYSWEKEDEEIQAKIIEYLYTLWFSHPNTEQIIYWNLVDGYAHVADATPDKIAATQGDMTVGENYYHGGLLRFDMSPKPAYFKIKDLIKNVWHTEGEVVADGNGNSSFRGFYGKYEVEVEYNGKKTSREIDLSKNSDNVIGISL